MPSFKIAHLREQGQDVIIVPLDQGFAHKSTQDQQGFAQEIQWRAHQAGLRGHVALVWDGGFLAPPNWHPFFKGIDLGFVANNLNRTLTW